MSFEDKIGIEEDEAADAVEAHASGGCDDPRFLDVTFEDPWEQGVE